MIELLTFLLLLLIYLNITTEILFITFDNSNITNNKLYFFTFLGYIKSKMWVNICGLNQFLQQIKN